MLLKYLAVFLVSMVPIIELRGALPIGLGMGLPVVPTYVICVLGNMMPVPFIYLFARKFLIWGCDKPLIGGICRFFIVKGEKAGRKLEAKAGRGLTAALLLFVGIPAAGHRRVDRHAGRLHPGYEVQGCADRLHGRRAAGGHHHRAGFGGPAGRAERPVRRGLSCPPPLRLKTVFGPGCVPRLTPFPR